MTKLLPKLYPFMLFLLGLLLFVPFLGYFPLFDTAEIRPAEVAREMLVTNVFSYAQLDFQPDYRTAPLLPWLQALSMRVFGVADNIELAARLPNALMGIITLLTLFYVGRKKHDAKFGLLWALSYVGSVTPLLLAKSALTATTGHFFAFLGMLFFVEAMSSTGMVREIRNLLMASLFFALGLLTNGAIVSSLLLILLLLVNYWRMEIHALSAKIRTALLILLLPAIASIIWLVSTPGPDWQRALFSANSLSLDSLVYVAAGLVGMLTMIMLSSRYWSANKRIKPASPETVFPGWMATFVQSAIITVVFIPDGLLLLWFPFSYLATYHIYQYLQGKTPWDRVNTYLLILSGVLVGGLLIAVPIIGMNPDWLTQQTSDPFWVGVSEAPVSWEGREWIIGAILIVLTTFFALRIRHRAFQSVIGLYVSTAFCTLAFWAIIAPKIEQYLQGPLVNFCESKWGQPVYVQPTFPSYAHLLYTRKKPPVNPKSRELTWLLNGPVDKQTTIITTASKAARYQYNGNLELLSEENGYLFLMRKQFR